jgi:hypothetical protein
VPSYYKDFAFEKAIDRRVAFYKVKLKGKRITRGEFVDFHYKINTLNYIKRKFSNNRILNEVDFFDSITRDELILLLNELIVLVSV